MLPVPPRAAFESGRFNRVPVIQGSNRDEGRLFSYLRAYRGDLWSEQSYKDIIAQMFGPRAGAILARYPAASFGSPGLAYAAVLTDSLFACASLTLDRLLQGHTAVYAYEFDDPQAPFSLPRAPWAEPVKAYHAAEIPYVFGSGWPLADAADFDANQMELSTRDPDLLGKLRPEPAIPKAKAPRPGPDSRTARNPSKRSQAPASARPRIFPRATAAASGDRSAIETARRLAAQRGRLTCSPATCVTGLSSPLATSSCQRP